MRILILEDDGNRHKEFKARFLEMGFHNYDIVVSANQCIEYLKSTNYDIIFFDHDLGGEVYVDTRNENTGSGVARWMVENENNFQADVIVHSFNPNGAQNIINILSGKVRTIQYVPGLWGKEKFHSYVKK